MSHRNKSFHKSIYNWINNEHFRKTCILNMTMLTSLLSVSYLYLVFQLSQVEYHWNKCNKEIQIRCSRLLLSSHQFCTMIFAKYCYKYNWGRNVYVLFILLKTIEHGNPRRWNRFMYRSMTWLTTPLYLSWKINDFILGLAFRLFHACILLKVVLLTLSPCRSVVKLPIHYIGFKCFWF